MDRSGLSIGDSHFRGMEHEFIWNWWKYIFYPIPSVNSCFGDVMSSFPTFEPEASRLPTVRSNGRKAWIPQANHQSDLPAHILDGRLVYIGFSRRSAFLELQFDSVYSGCHTHSWYELSISIILCVSLNWLLIFHLWVTAYRFHSFFLSPPSRGYVSLLMAKIKYYTLVYI